MRETNASAPTHHLTQSFGLAASASTAIGPVVRDLTAQRYAEATDPATRIAHKIVYNPRPMAADLTVAMLGLGEAGSTIAADLVAAGVTVRGYDPAVRGVEGVEDFGDEARGGARRRRRR